MDKNSDKIKTVAELASYTILNRAVGADRILVSIHTVKAGQLDHFFVYENFIHSDWPICLEAFVREAIRAKSFRDQTSKAKME